MAETLIANLDKTLVTVRAVSESNSVTYKINLCSSPNSGLKAPYLKLNDVNWGPALEPTGLSVRSGNDFTSELVQKSFVLTNANSTMNTSFVNYMNSLTHKFVFILSSAALRSSPEVDTWFNSVSSINWPGPRCNRFDQSYVAIYIPSLKRIVAEVSNGSDKPTIVSGHSVLETVVDSPLDFGAVGVSKKSVYDPEEYVTTSEYEFKRYPDNVGLVAPLADFGIKAGSKMMLSCELYQSSELVAAGLNTRLNLRWYTGTTLRDTVTVVPPSNVVNKYYKPADVFCDVPPDADGFTIVVARYPRDNNLVALASVKNVSLVEVSRPDQKSGDAAMGVNGIKTNSIIEGTTAPMILELVDPKTFAVTRLPIVGLKELELEY